jgi:2-C-methyl-D-erythritol 2,4-cyclodiphosphate synthase/2-C-methyl-D-erythritol 4-phosphate cytidylyltransferase
MTPADASARYWAIVPAAGRGERFTSTLEGQAPVVFTASSRKQYAALAGASVIQWSLRPLLCEASIETIVVPLAADDDHWPVVARRIAQEFPDSAHKLQTCRGGDSRQDSVLRGLQALRCQASPRDWVLVHDAARPCLPVADLAALLQALRANPAGALLAVPVADTLKKGDGGISAGTVDRTGLWRALTPQAFRFEELERALLDAASAGISVTDEAQALERIGIGATLIPASDDNIKVTRATDLKVAARTLATARGTDMRIGQGFDVHAFTDGDHVMLGGVRIAHRRGILAHSDGDVVIHALCDAILGALGEGDIGRHFPDTDARFRGADSRLFLRDVASLMRRAGWQVVNADITVTAQAPRIAAHASAMIENLRQDLQVDAARINIKATTTEKLGFIGREEGLAANAVVLLEPDRA